MTEYFRITGRNLIPFDALATGAADDRYHLKRPQTGMDEPMTEAEVKAVIGRLPQKIRGHALKRGLSKITFPFTIQGSSDPDMEDARHDVTETLEDGQLYIETKGARGTQAVLQNKADAAVNQSYKTIFYGEVMELGGRAVLGAPLKDHWLENLQMVLYCEPYWRPDAAVTLGPNEIYCPSFEEDGNADGLADNWEVPLGAELLLNTGFETPGGGDPDFWLNWDETAGTGALAHTAVVHAGADACQATAGATANTYVKQAAVVTAGEPYCLSFWTRGSGEDDGRYKVYDATAGADIIVITDTGVRGTIYVETTVFFVAPIGCASVEVYLYCPLAPGQIAYFDDVTIKEAAGLPSLESTIVLHGCDSQKFTTNAANERIESEPTIAPDWTPNLQSAVAYAWICRPAAGSDITVTIQETVGAPGPIAHSHLDAGGWQTAVGKGGQTWSCVVVSTAAGITEGSTYELWIEVTAVTGTVFYVDKCFWKWGTTTVPDEWCDHWLIYNHYDTDEGHQNYFDVDDLKGDTPTRGLMRVEFEKIADQAGAHKLFVARRTRPEAACFPWWLEAETVPADHRAAWAPIVLARCSGGSRLTDSANLTGYVIFSSSSVPPAFALDYLYGTYDIFAALYTDDPVNTLCRLSYSWGGQRYYSPWVRQVNTSKWELVKLGSLDFDPYLGATTGVSQLSIYVEYQKQAADTIEIDFVWLFPKDEPQMVITPEYESNIGVGEWWAVGNSTDFDYIATEWDVPPLKILWPTSLRGGITSMEPSKENRLYFVCLTHYVGGAPDYALRYEAHDTATGPGDALEMVVNIDYLPQYTSPLE